MEEKCKVLNIVSNLSQTNGVASYVINYYNYLDKNIDMEILVLMDLNQEHYQKFPREKIHEVFYNRKKNMFQYIKQMDNFFKNHSDYDIVHCQVANLGLIPLYFAKKYHIKNRILHSHSTNLSQSLWKRIRNQFILFLVRPLANHYFACSKEAGKAMFGKRKFEVIENAISFDEYQYDSNRRTEIRKHLNLEKQFVIGHVGRLSKEKNQKFLLEVFKEILKYKKNACLLLIGRGPLENELKNQIKELGIQEQVLLLGKRSDLKDLYQAMDCFILTSLFEGLPVTGVEAQASGLPCVFSDNITREADISGKVQFLPLDAGVASWAKKVILTEKINRKCTKLNENYNIKYAARKLSLLYKNMK